MTLPAGFEETVPRQVRALADAFIEQDGVTLLESNPEYITAEVRDNPLADVRLSRWDDTIYFDCSCASYRSLERACKHIWATLQVADEAGLFEPWEIQDEDELLPATHMEARPTRPPAGSDDADGMEDEADDAPDDEQVGGPINERRIRTASLPAQPARRKTWKSQVAALRAAENGVRGNEWPAGREILYVLDLDRTSDGSGLAVEVAFRELKKDGQWSKLKHEGLGRHDAATLPDPADREIIGLLNGAGGDTFGYGYYDAGSTHYRFRLAAAQLLPLVQRMCRSGRCRLRPEMTRNEPRDDTDAAILLPITWDDGPPWQFHARVSRTEDQARLALSGELRRTTEAGEERMGLTEPLLILRGGLLLTREHAATIDDGDAFAWISLLSSETSVSAPVEEAEDLLSELFSAGTIPPLELPEDLAVERVQGSARPRLHVHKPGKGGRHFDYNLRMTAELSFDYNGTILPYVQGVGGVYQRGSRRLLLRDLPTERDAAARLRALGFKRVQSYSPDDPSLFEIAPKALPVAVQRLISEQWHVDADGQLYRQARNIDIEVKGSGIDWFELHGAADFDGQSVALPKLLAALRRGEKTITLSDGTMGVLPEQWLKKYGALAAMGSDEGDHLKFNRTQVGVLDALLASQPEARCDEVFRHARQQLMDFRGVEAAEPPAGFIGMLRPYQKEGLGWLHFLRTFNFGGCLADDMGLGKTVQVLALLEERRQLRAAETNGKRLGPSLVVAPRSLIFNWMEEARRFAPKLRVLDHTGITRAKSIEAFSDFDVLLTTYGTLRNDAVMFKDLPFDYVVLDEAQAIKNSTSESAKAVRLLNGSHRLALSGTPVQNHLGELWSLFEFLNPGMLGTARAFQAGAAGVRVVEEQTRLVLSRALRPFILRRTKAQVASDLPERSEQTIHCELDREQRKLYDEMRVHYRQSLLEKIDREGINKSRMQILEALLRLRQIACHPGLIDKTQVSKGSAKLDALLPQLAEVTEGGHKALVFSQFTSMLSIVRDRLDQAKIPYEYLDGKTRDRATPVERFQTKDDCRLFLISLKAGGLGLNLTAAEYVFLLDPWWNPAVEAQAIDRAHRIGQTRRVFAYRLIAKDTVEEKVLQLQETKRELADAIINADNSVISKLGRDELQLLLS